MNEKLKKLTEDIRAQLAEALKSKEVIDLLASIKAAKESGQDTGTFEMVISTADIDRAGESVDQAGWELKHYLNNPIVLWAHDYSKMPVGVTDELSLKNGKLVAKGRFAPTDFGQEVRKLYDAKMLKTASVGFIPKEMEGHVITKAELLEWSFVPVPANPYALSLAKSCNLNVEELVTKGIMIKETEGGEEPEKKEDEEPEKNGEPEAEAKSKGAVADELTADQMWELKRQQMRKVYDVMDAFINVYFEEETPVDAFGSLLSETIGLLGSLAGTEAKAAETVKAFIGACREKKFAMTIEKEGRVLSDKNKKIVNDAIAKTSEAVAALEELLTATEPQGDESKSAPEEGEGKVEPEPSKVEAEEKQRSKAARFETEMKSLDDFVAVRRVLRTVDNVIGDSLVRINQRIRERSQKQN